MIAVTTMYLPLRTSLEPLPNGQVHFGLGLAVELQFFRKNARLGGDLVNGDRRRCLGDFDITGDRCKEVR